MKGVRSLGILDYRKIQELHGAGVLLFAPCRIHLRRTLVTARGSMNRHTKISDRAHPSQGYTVVTKLAKEFDDGDGRRKIKRNMHV
jgi:hypothetical protein